MATLNAQKRGDEKVKQLRREGYVPGVLFGKELGSLTLRFLKNEVLRFMNSNGKGSKVELVLDGKTYSALLKETEIDPVTREPIHLSFLILSTEAK